MVQTVWRVLIVEDQEAIGRELVDGIETSGWLDAGTEFRTQWVKSFADGLRNLEQSRFDIIVLDLRDDAKEALNHTDEEDQAKPGLRILERIRETRFVPVIF